MSLFKHLFKGFSLYLKASIWIRIRIRDQKGTGSGSATLTVSYLKSGFDRISMNLDEAVGIRRDVNPLLLEVSLSNVNRVSGSWNNFQRGATNNQKQSR
jgi:hypothetical protein